MHSAAHVRPLPSHKWHLLIYMELIAEILVDGSCNQPFQNGKEIVGENACGVGVSILSSDRQASEPKISTLQFSNCWIAAVTPGVCELAAVCFGLVHLRLLNEKIDDQHKYDGQSLNALTEISLSTDSQVAHHALQPGYVTTCPWMAPILYLIQTEVQYWNSGGRGAIVHFHKVTRETVAQQDRIAQDLRSELQRVLLDQTAESDALCQHFSRSVSEWPIESYDFKKGAEVGFGACFSRGMSELFLFSRDVHDCMWSANTHSKGTPRTVWCWMPSHHFDFEIDQNYFTRYGKLCAMTRRPEFERYGHPADRTCSFIDFRERAMADMKHHELTVLHSSRLCQTGRD